MRTLSRIQSLVQSSALLRTAIQEGSLQVVYRQPATISADRLTVTWRLSVLILDATLADVAQGALERLGFTVQRDAEVLQAVQDFLLTAQEKAALAAEESKAQQQAKQEQQQAQEQATATTIADLQAQIEALRDEVELLGLVKRKARSGPQGKPGPQGDAGPAGRDGRDLLATEANLRDLQDVADTDPEQGQVLTWDQAAGQWEPKAPRTGFASIGGGGAGGGAAGLTVGTYGPGGADVGTEVNTIRFDTASGFTVVEGPDGATEARVSMNSTFKTWKIEGQADVVAQGEDTMHLVAGPGMVLTTSPTEPKSITISRTGGGAGTGESLQAWGETIDGHLLPVENNQQDLGSTAYAIRNVYLGGGVLGVNAEGFLTWNGQPIALANDDYSPIADGGGVTETGTPPPVDFVPMIPGLEADGGSLF